VIFGGVMCGLGGAYLTLGWIPLWVEGMTAAKGWIVIAIVVVGLWHPVGVLFGAYIFGTFEVLQFTFQQFGIPPPFLNMLPSVTTILFLVMWGILLNRSKVKRIIGAPTSLCVPFERP